MKIVRAGDLLRGALRDSMSRALGGELGWAGLQILHFVDNDLIWELYIYLVICWVAKVLYPLSVPVAGGQCDMWYGLFYIDEECDNGGVMLGSILKYWQLGIKINQS